MSHNTFGHLFRVTTWGESHGPALGCVVDGCPPGIALDRRADIQAWLDKRRPGQGKFVTQRQEPDAVRILSGVFQDDRTDGQVTTGTPISLMIENVDQRSRDYSEIAQAFRPGHADYPYFAKYGVRDYRGGGRQSARETAARVAAGAVARKIIAGVTIRARRGADRPARRRSARWFDFGDQATTHSGGPTPTSSRSGKSTWRRSARPARPPAPWSRSKRRACPAGWGAPLYGKLDAELAAALMSINAAKGVEIGAGFASAALSGEENADEMRMGNDGPLFLSNHAGGVLGGISTGQPVVARVAFKPTSSILHPAREPSTRRARRSSCAPRAATTPAWASARVPVVEAMVACVLADAFLRHRAQTGGGAFGPDQPAVEPAAPDYLSAQSSV